MYAHVHTITTSSNGTGDQFTKYLGGILCVAYSRCLTAYIATYNAICSLRNLRLLGKFGE